YARHRFVCLELGLQTIHDRSLDWMNRGHHFDTFVDAVQRCQRLRVGAILSRPQDNLESIDEACKGPRKHAIPTGLDLCAHVILGLPGESHDDMLETADALASLPVDAVKIHNLHVVKDTPLEKMYERGEARMFERDEYVQIVCDFLERLRPEMVIY